MGSKILDVLFNRCSYEDRRRRFFRVAITANAIFLFAMSGATVRLWYAINTGETWRDYRGMVIDTEAFHRDLLIVGSLAILSLLSLGLLYRLSRSQRG